MDIVLLSDLSGYTQQHATELQPARCPLFTNTLPSFSSPNQESYWRCPVSVSNPLIVLPPIICPISCCSFCFILWPWLLYHRQNGNYHMATFPSSWCLNMKTSSAYTCSFFLHSSSRACLPAQTNLPIFALHPIPFYLLAKLALLVIPSFSAHLTSLSVTGSFCWYWIIFTSPKVQNLSLETLSITSVLPPLFIKAFFILNVHRLTPQANLIASMSQHSLKVPVTPRC